MNQNKSGYTNNIIKDNMNQNTIVIMNQNLNNNRNNSLKDNMNRITSDNKKTFSDNMGKAIKDYISNKISDKMNQNIGDKMKNTINLNMKNTIKANINNNIRKNKKNSIKDNMNNNINDNMNSEEIKNNCLFNNENIQNNLGNSMSNEENQSFCGFNTFDRLDEEYRGNNMEMNNPLYKEILDYKNKIVYLESFSISSSTKKENEKSKENKSNNIFVQKIPKEYEFKSNIYNKSTSNTINTISINNSNNMSDYEDDYSFINKKRKREISEEDKYNEVFRPTQINELDDKSSDIEESLYLIKERKNILEINIPDKIDLSQYNYNIYKDKNHLFQNYKFNKPSFISFGKIISNNKSMIENLCGFNKIFKNVNEIKKKKKNGKFYNHLLNILNEENPENEIKENIENEKLDERLQEKYNIIFEKNLYRPDNMARKIKIFTLEKIINYFNSIENGINEIKKLDYHQINEHMKRDFNLVYFDQYLYSILSNESNSENDNYKIIKRIIDSFNEKKEEKFCLRFLCLKYIDCFDIIRYNTRYKDINFDEDLENFLIEIYRSLKFDLGIEIEKEYEEFIKKDYICSLLLLIYNLEWFFYLKSPRDFRNKKNNGYIFKVTHY